jgi:hypothetical protein
VRVFVLDADQIKADKDPVTEEFGYSWWDVMVKEHQELGIQVSRVCLDDRLKAEYPELQDQMSFFSIPGEGAWMVIDRSRGGLERAVQVACCGRRAFHRYSGVAKGLPVYARKWMIGQTGPAVPLEEKVDSITRWM